MRTQVHQGTFFQIETLMVTSKACDKGQTSTYECMRSIAAQSCRNCWSAQLGSRQDKKLETKCLNA